MIKSKDKDFTSGKFTTIFGSTVSLVILLINLVIPILEIIFGAIYYNQCTINNNIPIFLIVSGACGTGTILLMILMTLVFLCCLKSKSKSKSCAAGCLIGIVVLFLIILSFFLFAWFIVGNVWIFSVKKNVVYDDVSSTNYCHRTLYEFAFWILIVSHIMSIVSCCVPCIASCCQTTKFIKNEGNFENS